MGDVAKRGLHHQPGPMQGSFGLKLELLLQQSQGTTLSGKDDELMCRLAALGPPCRWAMAEMGQHGLGWVSARLVGEGLCSLSLKGMCSIAT